MAPLLYPELPWPSRFGRFIGILQVVAIAGAIGAVAGSAAMLALVGNGPPPKPIIVGAGGDNGGKTFDAAKAAGNANGASQSAAPAVASPAPPAGSALSGVPQSPQPAAAPPAAGTAQLPQFAAATPQITGPAGAPAASKLYNRVEPAEHAAHARSAKLRAKENRRPKSLASRYARDRDRHGYESYGWGGPYQRGASQRGIDAGVTPRSGYRYYNAAPRSSYWGGGAPFGGWGGGWGGSWGNN
jgi:hypothetical protein